LSRLTFFLVQLTALLGAAAIVLGLGEGVAWGEAPAFLDAPAAAAWVLAGANFLVPLAAARGRPRPAGVCACVALCCAGPLHLAGNLLAHEIVVPVRQADLYSRFLLGLVVLPSAWAVVERLTPFGDAPGERPPAGTAWIGLAAWLLVFPLGSLLAGASPFEAGRSTKQLVGAFAIAIAGAALPLHRLCAGRVKAAGASRKWLFAGTCWYFAAGAAWLGQETLLPGGLSLSADWAEAWHHAMLVGAVGNWVWSAAYHYASAVRGPAPAFRLGRWHFLLAQFGLVLVCGALFAAGYGESLAVDWGAGWHEAAGCSRWAWFVALAGRVLVASGAICMALNSRQPR
jgi:hypothetical protein